MSDDVDIEDLHATTMLLGSIVSNTLVKLYTHDAESCPQFVLVIAQPGFADIASSITSKPLIGFILGKAAHDLDKVPIDEVVDPDTGKKGPVQ